MIKGIFKTSNLAGTFLLPLLYLITIFLSMVILFIFAYIVPSLGYHT